MFFPGLVGLAGNPVLWCSRHCAIKLTFFWLSVYRFPFLGEGPARGAPGPVRFLCILLSFLGGAWPYLGTGTGVASPGPLTKQQSTPDGVLTKIPSGTSS